MKYLNRLTLLALGSLAFTACSDIDEMVPEGGTVTEEQLEQTTAALPERMNADLAGAYTYMGETAAALGSTSYHNDYGIPALATCMDANASDMVGDNSGYNWFTPAFDYTDRNANYILNIMRYNTVYNQVKLVNDLISTINPNTEVEAVKHALAQARALRAFCYLNLAPYYQFNYATSKDLPCVPIVSPETPDIDNNPRATVAEVYDFIMADLNYAVEALEGYQRPSKVNIDQSVAYGLRARANLYMENWVAAAEDAAAAVQGYTPASIEEVSMPTFCDINEGNWMWGILIEKDKIAALITSASHLGSFSSNSYAAGVGCYKRINPLLWNKIPATDVRKGWWVDENLNSPLLEGLDWNGKAVGQEIATYEEEDVKVPFVSYTNVKFGMKSGIGSNLNDNDWPLMRAEEMLLIQAEALTMSGQTAEGVRLLNDFVKTFRDPNYNFTGTSAMDIQNEIWKQRRIELWGEGFSMADIMRLRKPVVRVHGIDNNIWPDGFAFNIAADDPWLLLRFPQQETNSNAAVTPADNNEGTLPVAGQNSGLRDGVTD